MTYHYLVDGNDKLVRNRLYHVRDYAGVTSPTYNNPSGTMSSKMDPNNSDLDDQGEFIDASYNDVENDNNYKYDAEGRLIQDLAEDIEQIIWRVDGKVKKVLFTSTSGKNNLEFDYDAFGRRIAKHVHDQQGLLVKSTYYILDASGNQLLTYEHVVEQEESNYQLSERVIYGSSRLGINTNKVDMLIETQEDLLTSYTGEKLYEMTNHLGNVLTVINDIKVPYLEQDNLLFKATIMRTYDYSPFGVQLDERSDERQFCETVTTTSTVTDLNDVFNNGTYQGWIPTSTTTTELTFPSNADWLRVRRKDNALNLGPIGAKKTVNLTADTEYTFSAGLHRGTCEGFTIQVRILDPNGNNAITPYVLTNTSGATSINFTFAAATNGTYTIIFEALEDDIECRFFIYDILLTHQETVTSQVNCVGADGYRFGFQGQEKDDEIKGAGNSVNYTYRMHDPRLGRFLSLDPKMKDFPHNSPYAFSENRVIDAFEFEGLEGLSSTSRVQFGAVLVLGKVDNAARLTFSWTNQLYGQNMGLEFGIQYEMSLYNRQKGISENSIGHSASTFTGLGFGAPVGGNNVNFAGSGVTFAGSGLSNAGPPVSVGYGQTLFTGTLQGSDMSQRIGTIYARLDNEGGSTTLSASNDLFGDRGDRIETAGVNLVSTQYLGLNERIQIGLNLRLLTDSPVIIDDKRQVNMESGAPNGTYITEGPRINNSSSLNATARYSNNLFQGSISVGARGGSIAHIFQNMLIHDLFGYPHFDNDPNNSSPNFTLELGTNSTASP